MRRIRDTLLAAIAFLLLPRLDTIPILSAGSIPGKARFYTYDLSSFGIIVDGPVYIGPF